MRRPLSQKMATLRGVRCECGLPATTQVKVVQLCYTGHYRGGVRFVQWMPLCEACAALHAMVEVGTEVVEVEVEDHGLLGKFLMVVEPEVVERAAVAGPTDPFDDDPLTWERLEMAAGA